MLHFYKREEEICNFLVKHLIKLSEITEILKKNSHLFVAWRLWTVGQDNTKKMSKFKNHPKYCFYEKLKYFIKIYERRS